MTSKPILDKKYVDWPAERLVDAPVSALFGLSEADGAMLARHLGIRTIGDLAHSRFVQAAQQIVAAARPTTEPPMDVGEPPVESHALPARGAARCASAGMETPHPGNVCREHNHRTRAHDRRSHSCRNPRHD